MLHYIVLKCGKESNLNKAKYHLHAAANIRIGERIAHFADRLMNMSNPKTFKLVTQHQSLNVNVLLY